MGGLGLNLNSLNDSVASSMSVRDMYSNSNLNSASSLSWADDVSLLWSHNNRAPLFCVST
jgi:hypothetical protein